MVTTSLDLYSTGELTTLKFRLLGRRLVVSIRLSIVCGNFGLVIRVGEMPSRICIESLLSCYLVRLLMVNCRILLFNAVTKLSCLVSLTKLLVFINLGEGTWMNVLMLSILFLLSGMTGRHLTRIELLVTVWCRHLRPLT